MKINNKSVHIACCFGTRPEIIKLAPVIHELENLGGVVTNVFSEQHEEAVVKPLLSLFDVKLHYRFNQASNRASLSEFSAFLLASFSVFFEQIQPDLVIVQGDTATAWQAAQAAFLMNIPVAHIEAGLRTGDLTQPFPEEANRTLIARLASFHFAPTPRAQNILEIERVPGKVYMVGNTVVDSTLKIATKLEKEELSLSLQEEIRLLFSSYSIIYITAHRRENWGEGIDHIFQAIKEAVRKHDHIACIWSLHPNPIIQTQVSQALAELPQAERDRVKLIPPQSYVENLWFIDHATLIVSDSGGIQEEAVTLGTPILITREMTERPEVLECGVGALVGTNPSVIVENIDKFLKRRPQTCLPAFNPFGNGDSGAVIARKLMDNFLNRS
jgi:UDP-N-acetylglucosamine 2-epimerase (non-hydrolysing)